MWALTSKPSVAYACLEKDADQLNMAQHKDPHLNDHGPRVSRHCRANLANIKPIGMTAIRLANHTDQPINQEDDA